MIQAVIFDRDGVLLDSEGTNIRAAERAYAHFGLSLTQAQRQAVVGRHPDEYLKIHAKISDIDSIKYKELQRKYYYEEIERTTHFTSTIRLVHALKQRGILVGLCTSASHEGTSRILSQLGLTGAFDVIVGKGDYANAKPAPDPYLAALQNLGKPASVCLAIEDSAIGLRSARAAGIACLVIANEHTRNHSFDGAEAVYDTNHQLSAEDIINDTYKREGV